ncbi:VUT family protein [Rhodovulum sp. DZ06]|uniref:VUT family protein n=1 Tax=Rhodovulum sp. DZ06 TaxID=3425126 RepID=UPI003D33D2AD
MTRGLALGILAMTAIVAASNILVQHLLGDWLTWGAMSYPFAFLVTDLTNRAYGATAARKVVAAGFVAGIACSFIAAAFDATTFRIALASGLAFLAAQMLDVSVFDRLRAGSWWRAPLASSLIGSAVDTGLFFSVAFAGSFTFLDPADDVSWAGEAIPLLGMGPAAPLWVSLAVADFGVKLALALIALAPFRAASRRIAAA